MFALLITAIACLTAGSECAAPRHYGALIGGGSVGGGFGCKRTTHGARGCGSLFLSRLFACRVIKRCRAAREPCVGAVMEEPPAGAGRGGRTRVQGDPHIASNVVRNVVRVGRPGRREKGFEFNSGRRKNSACQYGRIIAHNTWSKTT